MTKEELILKTITNILSYMNTISRAMDKIYTILMNMQDKLTLDTQPSSNYVYIVSAITKENKERTYIVWSDTYEKCVKLFNSSGFGGQIISVHEVHDIAPLHVVPLGMSTRISH